MSSGVLGVVIVVAVVVATLAFLIDRRTDPTPKPPRAAAVARGGYSTGRRSWSSNSSGSGADTVLLATTLDAGSDHSRNGHDSPGYSPGDSSPSSDSGSGSDSGSSGSSD